MSGVGKLIVGMAPFFAAVSVMYHYGILDTQAYPEQHYYQQMRKEADKQWPSKNKKLDWVLALAHGT
jgi:hypothetical protein